jgi:hypothetical protein
MNETKEQQLADDRRERKQEYDRRREAALEAKSDAAVEQRHTWEEAELSALRDEKTLIQGRRDKMLVRSTRDARARSLRSQGKSEFFTEEEMRERDYRRRVRYEQEKVLRAAQKKAEDEKRALMMAEARKRQEQQKKDDTEEIKGDEGTLGPLVKLLQDTGADDEETRVYAAWAVAGLAARGENQTKMVQQGVLPVSVFFSLCLLSYTNTTSTTYLYYDYHCHYCRCSSTSSSRPSQMSSCTCTAHGPSQASHCRRLTSRPSPRRTPSPCWPTS